MFHGLALRRVVHQRIEQTEARRNDSTGDLVRGGPEMIARTVERWRYWPQAKGAPRSE